MVASAWKTGRANPITGGGYGIRIRKSDRDRYFRRDWKSAKVELDSGEVHEIKISGAFWGNCCELRSRFIGKWMIQRGLIPWPKSNPPSFRIAPIEGNFFRLFSP